MLAIDVGQIEGIKIMLGLLMDISEINIHAIHTSELLGTVIITNRSILATICNTFLWAFRDLR